MSSCFAGATFAEIGVGIAWLPHATGGGIAIVGVDDGMSHGTNYDNGSLRLWDPTEREARWVLAETDLGRLLLE
ncbi:MAG: hypothetical protein HZA52_12660 [Planctomycetes bacterium]|nr:hypothetical protein [Planctomycetota bacterium]